MRNYRWINFKVAIYSGWTEGSRYNVECSHIYSSGDYYMEESSCCFTLKTGCLLGMLQLKVDVSGGLPVSVTCIIIAILIAIPILY